MPDETGQRDSEIQHIALLLTRDRLDQITKETGVNLALEDDGSGYKGVLMAGRTVVGALPPTGLLEATTSILILVRAAKSRVLPKNPSDAIRGIFVSGRSFTAEVEPNPHG